MTEEQVRAMVVQALSRRTAACPDGRIPVEVSARHVHLTKEALQVLFGADAVLDCVRPLSQPGEYLSGKRVRLLTPGGDLAEVAVLGPVREAVQVELALSDARRLGLELPVNLSGDLSGGANVCLVGTAGVLHAEGCAIAAKAHIHMSPGDAARLGVRDGQPVRIQVQGKRKIVFEEVAVRVGDAYALAMHIDTDEAAACGISGKASGLLIQPKEGERP